MAELRSRIFAPGLLDGRVCLVSGAGTGLGRATAFELAALGATVVGCGRRPEPLEETAAMIADGGGRADAVPTDIRDAEAVAELISPKGFRTVVELNVQGTWQMTHAAATRAFIPQRSGKVVSVTVSPHHGMPGMVHTGAARAAVENMMRTLSIEWARFGIRLCAVAAGQFDTEVLRTKYPEEVSENVARTVPLGRLGAEDEMAWLVAFLASPAGDFFSGAVLTIDGARDNWFGSWPPAGVADAEGTPLSEERRPRG